MFTEPTIWIAFLAGVLSFISPCNLPLYPSYISYITGVSVSELKTNRQAFQRKTILHTLFFMLGFSIIFIALGLSASLVGQIFINNQTLIRQVGGIIIIVMGLFLIGFFKTNFLMRERRFQVSNKPVGYLGSTFIGISFAAGWTPCIGPILSSVLILSATNPSQGLIMTVSYTLGFAIPFFIMSFFIGKLKFIQKHAHRISIVGGALMILVGILLFTDQMTVITVFLIRLFGGFTGF
jgi:cytochrome c-type biogenesis protein